MTNDLGNTILLLVINTNKELILIKRNTIQCAEVLKAVQAMKNHPTADEVYEEVARENPSISKGTVYRNLNRLDETGQIHRLSMPEGPDHFDHCCTEHYHVRCISCGRVFDVDMDFIPDLDKKIRDKQGFDFTGCDIVFRGICPGCKNKSGKN